jgi:hypothetical protein
MKKIIATLILACSTLVGLSQTTFSNNVIVQNVNPTAYPNLTVKADSSEVNLVTFGSSSNVGTLYDNKSAGVATASNRMFIINEQSNGIVSIASGGYGATNESIRIKENGQILLMGNCATHPIVSNALVTIGNGNGAGKLPLKILPAPLVSTPEPFSFEVDLNGNLYWTNASGVRTKVN